MKKLLLFFFLFAVLGGNLMAQDFMYEFASSDGTIIPDGSVVTITQAIEYDDGSGDVEMNSGLYAKNVNADEDQLVRIAYDVQSMDNGLLQICFPSACKNIKEASAGYTNPGTLMSALQTIATEWYPTAYGKCTVKVNLEAVVKTVDGYTVVDDGPGITLQFVYANSDKVGSMSTSVATPVAYYSLSGQRLSAKARGVALVRLSDGRVVKRICR